MAKVCGVRAHPGVCHVRLPCAVLSVFTLPENTVSVIWENGKDMSGVPITNLCHLATSHGGVAGGWAQRQTWWERQCVTGELSIGV